MNEELEQLKIENEKLKTTNQLLIHVLYLLRDIIANPDNQKARNKALKELIKLVGE